MADLRTTLGQLQTAARGFGTKNHASYLAEALQCTLDTKDPVATLKLLVAMWGPFAGRGEPQAALNDVGQWLEARLCREPTATCDDLAWELGWLRRFAKIEEATREDNGHSDHRGNGPPRAFGERIDRIETRRAEATAARRRRVDAPTPPPPPTQLPAVFPVVFVDLVEARKARQTARKRAKEGKPAKERWLDLRPMDPKLLPLAAGLVCSVQLAEEHEALFEHAPYYVMTFDERAGKKVVTAFAPQPPPDNDQASLDPTSPTGDSP